MSRMAQGFSPKLNTDYYTLIGVDRNATAGEIKKAIHKRAKQVHPDKTLTSETEEKMKELNKIKSVLLDDEVEKRNYDEELYSKTNTSVPLYMRENRGDCLLPPASRFSEDYIILYNKSKKQFSHHKRDNTLWKKFDQELSKISCQSPPSSHSRDEEVQLRVKKGKSHYKNAANASNRFSTADDDDDNDCAFDTIQSIVKRMHEGTSGTFTDPENGVVPILDTTTASDSDLRKFLDLFVSNVHESVTRDEIKRMLSKFIPVTAIQYPSKQKFSNNCCASCMHKYYWYSNWSSKKFSLCYWCKREFCHMCPLSSYQFPRTGLNSHALCMQCVDTLSKADAEDWAEASMRFLGKNDDDSVLASFGCASVAMALGKNSLEFLKNMAQKLHARGLHDLALTIISLVIPKSLDEISHNKQALKIHLLASSILKDLARASHKTWEEKWCLALAAKDAYVTAVSMIEDTNIEVSSNRAKEIEDIVHHLLDLKKKEHEQIVFQYTVRLEVLWKERNILGMLNYLKEISTEDANTATVIEEDKSLKAFQDFLQNKEPHLSSMLPEDQHALLFLKGLLKIKEKKFDGALVELNSAAWSGHHSKVPSEFLSSFYFHLLSEPKSALYSYTSLNYALQNGLTALLLTPPEKIPGDRRSKCLFFPNEEELTPPFKNKWPQLAVVGHNTRCHQKYEEAVLKLFDEKKWTHLRVAWAYLDQIPGCKHPAEMTVCFLHAALWLTKKMKPQSKLDSRHFFAQKCVTIDLLRLAQGIASQLLNPGMELYVTRIAIGIIRKMALTPNYSSVITEEDTSFLKILLERLVKVSRLFPNWEIPPVSVSEAVMLNIITKDMHCDFIHGLQTVNEEHRPLTNLELNYQIYENDLRGIFPLENSSDSRARAMDELLKAQNWSWNDVVHNMSSRLTPRDTEGWFKQSPTLGITQEYSQIDGFVINMDPTSPSIRVLVTKTDPRRGVIGLFSQEDINAMLQLDISDTPLFFSLDPPKDDLDKHYHPFQEWRYQTDKLKDTEILNTMFTTDYLMKSFSVGSDVSALPPFKQRPCKEGLTKDLPPHLQEAIRSIPERGGIQSRNSTHRFWIESKNMKYDCKQDGLKMEFRFGGMEMIVKSHSIVRRSGGELVDTDEEDDPDSPHARFAKEMTASYSELSTYFPVFARLRELSKIQVFFIMLHSVLDNLKESFSEKIKIPKELVEKIQDDVRKELRDNLSRALNEMKQEVGVWPKARDVSLVQSKVSEVRREMMDAIEREEERIRSLHGYNVIVDSSDAMKMLDSIESEVLKTMRKNDEGILSQIVEALRESCKIGRDHRLEEHVKNWLSTGDDRYSFLLPTGRNTNTSREILLQYLFTHLPVPTHNELRQIILDHRHQQYQALYRLVHSYKSKRSHRATACKWVPAAIAIQSTEHSHSLSYGGVAFQMHLEPCKTVPRKGSTVPVSISLTQSHATKTSNVTYVPPKGNARSSDSKNNSSGNGSSGGSQRNNSSSKSTTLPREASAAASNEDRRCSAVKKSTKIIDTVTKKHSAKEPNINETRKQPGRALRGAQKFTENHSDHVARSTNETSRRVISREKKSEALPLKSARGIYHGPGIYTLRNTRTGECYVGRSNNVNRRLGEHLNSIIKGERKVTVSKRWSSADEIECFCKELPTGLSSYDMRFQEQYEMDHTRNLINPMRAMREKTYNSELKARK